MLALRRLGSLSGTVSSRLRRVLSTAAASRPEWAMIFQAPLVRSSAPRPYLLLLEPPCASCLLVPVNLVIDPRRPDLNANIDFKRRIVGGCVHAASGDGLLLLDFWDLPDMDTVLRADVHHGVAREVYLGDQSSPEDPKAMRFVCNPVSGEMFRLPEGPVGMRKGEALGVHGIGLLTNSARGHGPPDRYAVAEIEARCDNCNAGAPVFTLRRFLSQTGKWDELVWSELPRGLLEHRGMAIDHEVVAFAGRLWWVDVTCGALSVDPFSDRPDVRFVQLPSGSVTDRMAVPRKLTKYRRMGVSEGRLRYVEVSPEEPFVLSSFALDNDSGSWTLEHRTELSRLWVPRVRPRMEDAPLLAVIDPLNAHVTHITVGNFTYEVDMDKGKLLGRSWHRATNVIVQLEAVCYFNRVCSHHGLDQAHYLLQELLQAARPRSTPTLCQTFWFVWTGARTTKTK